MTGLSNAQDTISIMDAKLTQALVKLDELLTHVTELRKELEPDSEDCQNDCVTLFIFIGRFCIV